jgi:hypothetical protein
MTKHSIEILLERVAWQEEAQDEFVKSLAEIECKHAGVYRLSEEERAPVRRGLADLHAGRIASDEAVAALCSRWLV